MPHRTVVHSTFSIERSYPEPVETVFAAWVDPAQKRSWFVEGEGWTIDGYEADIREGGYERSRFRFKDGPPMTNDTTHHDIVPNRRIISSYSMTIDGRRISSSLATLEFQAEGSGTRLVYTEQGAFLDGLDQPKQREEGCAFLMGALATYLSARHP